MHTSVSQGGGKGKSAGNNKLINKVFIEGNEGLSFKKTEVVVDCKVTPITLIGVW